MPRPPQGLPRDAIVLHRTSADARLHPPLINPLIKGVLSSERLIRECPYIEGVPRYDPIRATGLAPSSGCDRRSQRRM
ncbi:hypothetical protein KIN20_032487 [Parelaphostrongylus tenuis]|uniref:Uncharacterized protein n=1 Tax=Parelaphostrongylus tenuis TaxID=148309 RepID=A0AAD5R749_PARTN|nr:hypothetical protein KIN20_032487 [Parelaphostrongylus tenuis]